MNYWFNTPDSNTLCRGGGNGPIHPSQFMGLAYINLGDSVLDVGCGSGASLEIMRKTLGDNIKYKGVDFIQKHIDWCKQTFTGEVFEVQNALSLKEPDKSWDVVWSRHVIDHLRSFESGITEQMRVAKRAVICILWRPFVQSENHEIKNIIDQGKVYSDEYTNDYSRIAVKKFLDNQSDWNYKIIEEIGYSYKRTDILIVIERINND